MINDNDTTTRYRVVQANAPCVIEVHKTLDNKSFYKSGDIGQVLLVWFINGRFC